jgi:Arc/MetJ-type ribon-helix-helix transcriptional regulator
MGNQNPKTETKAKKESKAKKQHQSKLDELGSQVEKIAVRTAESIKKVIDKALASRNTVLTIRVNDESNDKLNMLVEAGLFKSRSESAAYLIQEGIKSQEILFAKMASKMKQIEKIKKELKNIVSKEIAPPTSK